MGAEVPLEITDPQDGLGDSGGVRVGLAPYTNEEDIERLLSGLRDLLL